VCLALTSSSALAVNELDLSGKGLTLDISSLRSALGSLNFLRVLNLGSNTPSPSWTRQKSLPMFFKSPHVDLDEPLNCVGRFDLAVGAFS
jgi:hypothetical protein